MTHRLTPCFALIIVSACTFAPITSDTTDTASSSSQSPEQSQSSPKNMLPPSSGEMLNMAYSSTVLGIALRYPSTYFDQECGKNLPVLLEEKDGQIDFVLTQVFDAECNIVPGDKAESVGKSSLIDSLFVQRATDESGVQRFIDRVFPYHCEIYERSEDRLFLRSVNPPIDAPDLDCGESIVWRKDAGVVYFSRLGSKTGGGNRWPSEPPDREYQFAVMQSITFP